MEELQALWHNASDEENTQVSKEELDALVSQSSSNELAKLRKVIYLEYVATWFVLPILVFSMYWRSVFPLLAISLLVLTVYLLYFYRKALRQFDQIRYEDNIQNYLQKALSFVKTYVRRYKMIYWVTIGFGIIIGYSGGYYSEGKEELQFTASSKWNLAIIGGLVITAILFTHFYIKYLYQARINKLEELLQDFSEK